MSKKRGIYNQINYTDNTQSATKVVAFVILLLFAAGYASSDCTTLKVLCRRVCVHFFPETPFFRETPFSGFTTVKGLESGWPSSGLSKSLPSGIGGCCLSQLHPKVAVIKHVSVFDCPRIVWIPKVTFADSDHWRQWIFWNTYIQPAEMYSPTSSEHQLCFVYCTCIPMQLTFFSQPNLKLLLIRVSLCSLDRSSIQEPLTSISWVLGLYACTTLPSSPNS